MVIWLTPSAPPPQLSAWFMNDPSDWNVQVFRSITSDSARFQLEKETSFTTKKGNVTRLLHILIQIWEIVFEFFHLFMSTIFGLIFCIYIATFTF